MMMSKKVVIVVDAVEAVLSSKLVWVVRADSSVLSQQA